MIDPKLLDLLCCPACRGDLHYDPEHATLTCRACKKVYRIVDDIPILIHGDNESRAR